LVFLTLNPEPLNLEPHDEDSKKLNDHLQPIEPDEQFRFACSPGVACFNACCRDLNQSLFPYDILRLKKRLKLPNFWNAIRPGTSAPVRGSRL
jgi:hypothetical protein